MVRFKVAIIIPAFNEEFTIASVVRSVKAYGVAIVVNDASTDKTKQMAENAGAILVNHKENKGYDGALNSGFIRAEELNCNAIITFDADGQHNSIILPEFIKHLKLGKDLVIGYRPRPARISEWIFMIYTRTKYKWKDPLCGMKGYSIGLFQKQGYFDSYNSIGTELAFFGLLNNCTYSQIFIPISERQDKPRFSSTLLSNIKILKSLVKAIVRIKNKKRHI
jgi:glycosyltransferase involved in cell wall biosynthesis